MTSFQVLRHELQSDSIYDGIKSLKNIIGALNISNDITKEDITDLATITNEFSLVFSDEEIIFLIIFYILIIFSTIIRTI